jgi:hypothetical protein
MLKRCAFLLVVLIVAISIPAFSQWQAVGPFGGNARALAADPSNRDHLLLGSGAGALFESIDGGRHWKHFAQLGSGHELMLKNIAFDPSHPATIYVVGWSLTGTGGGFFVSRDGGRIWSEPAELRGKSIQALALAESDPRILVAASLDGLYRSTDRGERWERITPAGHPDLKNFESVTIDPHDPKIIYAGTWHLPWKTTDGGATWRNIKQGLIDDSDVFSIILGHSNPRTVYASACSGIYKSENGGELFHKVQGIPSSARRTLVLQQDPEDINTVYAGTTEGLWKTTDGGKVFKLISPPNYILNDVLVDPRNAKRVLIATDRGGVFASDDAGQSFYPSNEGFSQRQITALVADSEHPGDLYAGVLNDKEFGGVFRSHDGRWSQLSEGLGGSDVFDLAESSKGKLVAATNHGLYVLSSKSQRWEGSKNLVRATPAAPGKPVASAGRGRTARKAPKPAVTRSTFEGRATAVALNGQQWYAATEAGVLVSANEGESWSGGAVDGEKEFFSVSANGGTVAAATLRGVWQSNDAAAHWSRLPLPEWVTRVYAVTVTGDETLWIATSEGALRWARKAKGTAEWEHVLNGLPPREILSIRAEGSRLVAGAAGSKTVYVSRDEGRSWKAEPAAGVEVTGAVLQGEALYVTTRHHGVLLLEGSALATAIRPGGQ